MSVKYVMDYIPSSGNPISSHEGLDRNFESLTLKV